jgi:peptidoglycan/LPS O-acetylase OafA/YrhL
VADPAAAPRRPAAGDFRSDINGLRALAVAVVIAFHLAGLPGGFVGVDVFFVISGYLMTRIIVTRLAEGRFGLWSFYLARARRIWPALAALCAALLAVGATLLDPWTFTRIAGLLPAALTFTDNFVLAGRSGYFAPDERDNWLLHTWSLAVEWQFYLLFPLLLMAVFALPALRRRLWAVLAGLAALSFALALWQGVAQPTQAFYGLPARAWELLAGGLCVWLERRLTAGAAVRTVGHVAGLALIALGCWLARPLVPWPSPVTLLPVGGAALVVACAAPRTLWADVPAIAAVGRASYSIYLWHWPLIVALRYAGVALTWPVALAAAAVAIGAGFASYWLVERAATGWIFAGRRGPALAGAAAVAAVLGLSLAAIGAQGFEAWRTQGDPPAIRAALADDHAAAHDWAFPGDCGRRQTRGDLELCYVGDPAAREVLVLGDSHAQQLVARYAHVFDVRQGAGAAFLTDAGCVPIPGVRLAKPGSRCARWADDAYRWAAAAPYRRVVIVSAWVIYYDASPAAPAGITCLAAAGGGCAAPLPRDRLAAAELQRLTAALARLRAAGKQVVLVGPTPQTDDADPFRLYKLAYWRGDLDPPPLPRAAFAARAALVLRLIGEAARAAGAVEVEPLDHLCPAGACPLSLGGRALYKDRGHFRASRMGEPRYAYLDPWIMK